MILTVLALGIFTLTAFRFVRRARQEGRRQRVLTWPRATAVLAEGENDLVAATADRYGETVFYRAELKQPYTFYARGERYTGSLLAPRLNQLNGSERKLFLRGLEQSRKFLVYFNPDDPHENYLTVGPSILTYGKEVAYVLAGVVYPILLGWFASPRFPPTYRLEVLMQGGLLIAALLLALYFLVLPPYDLGKLLTPVTGEEGLGAGAQERRSGPHDVNRDSLLDSLAKRPIREAQIPERLPSSRTNDPR